MRFLAFAMICSVDFLIWCILPKSAFGVDLDFRADKALLQRGLANEWQPAKVR